MTVWIGPLGAMVETACLSGLQVVPQDRTVYAGGPGTLAPPRAVAWGNPYRVWQATIDSREPGQLATLQTLAMMQHKYGGTYRMLACDAHNTNAFTPEASTDFTGWEGVFTIGATYTRLVETVGGGTVLYPDSILNQWTQLESGLTPRDVQSVVAVTADPSSSGTVLTSPIVPVIPGAPVTFGAFGMGSMMIRAQWVDANGDNVGSATTLVSVSHGSQLKRATPTVNAPTNVAGVRMILTNGTLYAWPSITWTAGARRYATGRGAEAVMLSPISESMITSTRYLQRSGFSYEVREVPAA